MHLKSFKGIYLQLTGYSYCYSFVTYTPQAKEQMTSCSDLEEKEEYFNPVVIDFLLFLSERVLSMASAEHLLIGYDDVDIICSRKRGDGVQHEHLLRVNTECLNSSQIE